MGNSNVSLQPLKRGPRGLIQEYKKAAAEKQFRRKLLCTREVVKLYGVCAHQVMNKVRAGLIPRPIKFQNCNYFIRTKVEAARRNSLKHALKAA